MEKIKDYRSTKASLDLW